MASRAEQRLARLQQQLQPTITTTNEQKQEQDSKLQLANTSRLDRLMDRSQLDPATAKEFAMYSSSQRVMFQAEHRVPSVDIGMKIDHVKVYKIPKLSEYLELQQYPNNFKRTRFGQVGVKRVTEEVDDNENEVILVDIARRVNLPKARCLIRAGPRRVINWAPGEVVAAIVTCGGLCPGLNDVIEELVNCLYYNYGVDTIYGVREGYSGFAYRPWKKLLPHDINGVHLQGGTCLGSSRGGFDMDAIIGGLTHHKVNQIYIVGGDGTHRAAAEIANYCLLHKLKIAVACVPKTIDNDIGIIDRSFGFYTAVEEAQRAIVSARVEACCTPGGIGIVKLMGRECGMIAAYSTIASREVDLCLIPEVPFTMDGPNGVAAYIEQVVKTRGHAVIVVAEGAGVHIMGDTGMRDPSGNKVLPDIGNYLKKKLTEHFKKNKINFSIKYNDPSYMIRSIPANASDSAYCMLLAQNAVHGAMAGFTAFTSALVNNRTAYVPVTLIAATSPVGVGPTGRTWERVLSATHQPTFT